MEGASGLSFVRSKASWMPFNTSLPKGASLPERGNTAAILYGWDFSFVLAAGLLIECSCDIGMRREPAQKEFDVTFDEVILTGRGVQFDELHQRKISGKRFGIGIADPDQRRLVQLVVHEFPDPVLRFARLIIRLEIHFVEPGLNRAKIVFFNHLELAGQAQGLAFSIRVGGKAADFGQEG